MTTSARVMLATSTSSRTRNSSSRMIPNLTSGTQTLPACPASSQLLKYLTSEHTSQLTPSMKSLRDSLNRRRRASLSFSIPSALTTLLPLKRKRRRKKPPKKVKTRKRKILRFLRPLVRTIPTATHPRSKMKETLRFATLGKSVQNLTKRRMKKKKKKLTSKSRVTLRSTVPSHPTNLLTPVRSSILGRANPRLKRRKRKQMKMMVTLLKVEVTRMKRRTLKLKRKRTTRSLLTTLGIVPPTHLLRSLVHLPVHSILSSPGSDRCFDCVYYSSLVNL